ncbi:MAG: phenylalanine--tRNA ligase subunit alpha [Bacteroidetes bacterium]|nr:phenylalanine--tRNA ligase subunit alpha [Bacteroidota bacterium]
MQDQILDIEKQVTAGAAALSSQEAIESFRIQFLGRKGKISELFDQLPNVPKEERGNIGKKLNQLKNEAQRLLDQASDRLKQTTGSQPAYDVTLPGTPLTFGKLHPISVVMNEMIDIFRFLGFSVENGPELEHDFYNFEALNFEADHPARDMQDTFFIDKDVLLRTHTSPVQIRLMEKKKPPIRSIMPGRVYRNEAVSARSYCVFHQLEGLLVDEQVSMVDLKSILLAFSREFFGPNTKIKLRPSFFPFTEPSAEVDVSCHLCHGKGCRVCKHSGWLEILGCGMVDPNVFKSCGIDPEHYTGYAFGMGIERITMMRYGVDDIRLLYDNNTRFLQQF